MVEFLRRFYLGLLTIALIVIVTILLVSPQTINQWATALSEQSSVVRTLVAVLLDVVLLALLYLQVRPDPRARATGLMMQASGAITEVSIESARAHILKAVSDVPDVVSADAQVKPIRGKADVEMQVTVLGQDVQLPAKQKEINRALNQVIHKQLGLRMAGQPRVQIRFQGEEAVKPARSLPIAPPEPVVMPKPIPTAIEAPRPVEVIEFVPVDKSNEEKASEPVEEGPKAEARIETTQNKDDELSFDLEKEITSSAADDIVLEEKPSSKQSEDANSEVAASPDHDEENAPPLDTKSE